MRAVRKTLLLATACCLVVHAAATTEGTDLRRHVEETDGCGETCLEPTGRCQDGLCVCEAGYGGVDCQSSLRTLGSGDVFRNQVLAPQEWDYYVLKLPDTDNHGSSNSRGKIVEFGFRWSGGDPKGYIKYEEFPTGGKDELVFDFERVASSRGGMFRLDANRVSSPGPYYLGIQNGVMEGGNMTYSIEMETYSNSFMRLSPVISIVVGGIAAVTLCVMLFACKKLATARVSSFMPRRSNTIRTASASRTVGLPKDVVDSFESLSYRDLDKEADVACAICLDDFKSREKVIVLPQCGHTFHLTCIKEWFAGHTTCPICRTDLSRGQSNEGNAHDLLEAPSTREQEDSVTIQMSIVPYAGSRNLQHNSANENEQVRINIRQDSSEESPMLSSNEVASSTSNPYNRTPRYLFIV